MPISRASLSDDDIPPNHIFIFIAGDPENKPVSWWKAQMRIGYQDEVRTLVNTLAMKLNPYAQRLPLGMYWVIPYLTILNN